MVRAAGVYLVLEGGKPVLLAERRGERVQPVNGLAGARLDYALSTLPALLRVPAACRDRRLEVHV